MKRILALFLTAAMVLCVLSGCSSDATSAAAAASDEATASSGETTNAITVAIPQDLDSLDPYSMQAAGTREVMFNVFEGLVKLSSDGSYVDAVAASHTISDDGLTYTFTLRDGVVFHNGQTVTVDDVVYSLETCAATTVTEAVATALSACSVSAEGNDIILTLDTPNSDLLAYLSNAYIVPKDYTDQATAPVGTGPFRFVSYSAADCLVVEKNTDYYGTQAYLDQVTFKVFSDKNAEITAVEAGTVDLCAHLTYDLIETLQRDMNVLEGTMNLSVALYLNNAVTPFDNELVRQAMCYAIDVDEIMSIVNSGYGVKIGSSMFPNFGKYFDASLADAYGYDPDKAKELLAEAGYADGFSFSITVPSNYTNYVDMAAVIKEQLAQVGITAEITQVEWATWLSDTYQGRSFDSTIIGFDTSVLTAGGMLERWNTDAGSNMINYSNAEYDETFAAATASTDDAEQTALYKRCLEILSETAANVYMMDLPEFVVINPALEGYEFYPLYIMDMSTIRYAG